MDGRRLLLPLRSLRDARMVAWGCHTAAAQTLLRRWGMAPLALPRPA